MHTTVYRLTLAAMLAALLALTGCNSSGDSSASEGSSGGEQPRDPEPEEPENPDPEQPQPEARVSVLEGAAELVPLVLVDRLANQSGQLDEDIKERLFKTSPVNEHQVHRLQLHCLSALYRAELAFNDALLAWRNAYPEGTDASVWLAGAAEEDLVALLEQYGERLYAAAVRPLDPEAGQDCAPFARDEALPKPDSDDAALNQLLVAMGDVERGVRDYRRAVDGFDQDNLAASFGALQAPLQRMSGGIQQLRHIARDAGLQRMKAALTNLSGRDDGTGGSGSIPRLDAWLSPLANLDTTGMDDRAANHVTQLFDDLFNKTGFLNWLENHQDDIKDDDARQVVFEQIDALRDQLALMRVDMNREPASALQDDQGRVSGDAVDEAMARLEQESDVLYDAMLNLAGGLAVLLLAAMLLLAGRRR